MQLSRYFQMLISPHGNEVAVFNELHPEPLYLNLELLQDGVVTPELLVSEFGYLAFQRRLVVESAKDDVRFLQQVQENVVRKISDPFILYLNLSSGCNFNCTYCPVPGLAAKHGEHVLTSKQAETAISNWYEMRVTQNAKTNFIIFYGGEPLLNKAVFESSLEFISRLHKQREGGLPIDLLIVTNGSLLDNEMISLCKQHRVTVVVGLDGLTVHQNRTRLWGQEPAIHYAVVSNLKRVVKSGLRTAVSLTLTPYNLDSLEKIVEELGVIGIKEIGFNFLKNPQSIPELNTPEKLDAFWQKSAVIAFRVGKEFAAIIPEFQYQKKATAWESKDFFPLDCTCLGNQIVVQGDGYLSNCPFRHRDGVGPESISTVTQNALGWLDEFRLAHPLWNPAYASVPEKAMCGQGCNMGGSSMAIDRASYYYSKEAFHDFLWNRKRDR